MKLDIGQIIDLVKLGTGAFVDIKKAIDDGRVVATEDKSTLTLTPAQAQAKIDAAVDEELKTGAASDANITRRHKNDPQ